MTVIEIIMFVATGVGVIAAVLACIFGALTISSHLKNLWVDEEYCLKATSISLLVLFICILMFLAGVPMMLI